jgi:hypothetical protein
VDAVKQVLQAVKDENLPGFSLSGSSSSSSGPSGSSGSSGDAQENACLKALRFLRARRFDVAKTMEMVRADAEWRADNDVAQLQCQTVYEVLQCDLSVVYTYFPTWTAGFDREGKPVSWRQFGTFDIDRVLQVTTMERLIDFHVWTNEQLLRLMHAKGKLTGTNLETFTVVVDAAGWQLSLANQAAYTFVKTLVQLDSDHYPERLGTLLVINAPAALSVAWRAVAGFMDDTQKAKMKIYSTNREEWLPPLLEIIDESQIPQQFGGKMPDFPQDLAVTSLEPPPRSFFQRTRDDDTVAPDGQVICGVQSRRKKGTKKKPAAGDGGAVDFDAPPSSAGCVTVTTGPLCGVGAAAAAANADDPRAGKKKSGWKQFLTCAPPQCVGGEEDFDFQMEVPVAAAASADVPPPPAPVSPPAPEAAAAKAHAAAARAPSAPQQPPPHQPRDFGFSDVYDSPDSIEGMGTHPPPGMPRAVSPGPGPGPGMGVGMPPNMGAMAPGRMGPGPGPGPGPGQGPAGYPQQPLPVPMFTNQPPNTGKSAPVVTGNNACSGCNCTIM